MTEKSTNKRLSLLLTKCVANNTKGFTLMEILIVVMIIGLIASLIAPNIMGRFARSQEEIAKAQVEMLSSSVQSFYLDIGRCPADLNELIVSTEKLWRGPYLSKKIIPEDPWHRAYQYKCPGEHGTFDLYSLGPNGKVDDQIIKNW
ncbi:type II secretion system major pseudopilin GspG [Candidatus Magnetomonas plexicatena]|uniref:type II secretion system major pseudopilin GspG n=1 Tax=Candidatus Magnetomonas plexicatena TaxID=2552947 RepID=UPI001C75842F|nr:type II secretion system major pseudopilin GspG [Nitrospirales bacterium LBB_01]